MLDMTPKALPRSSSSMIRVSTELATGRTDPVATPLKMISVPRAQTVVENPWAR